MNLNNNISLVKVLELIKRNKIPVIAGGLVVFLIIAALTIILLNHAATQSKLVSQLKSQTAQFPVSRQISPTPQPFDLFSFLFNPSKGKQNNAALTSNNVKEGNSQSGTTPTSPQSRIVTVVPTQVNSTTGKTGSSNSQSQQSNSSDGSSTQKNGQTNATPTLTPNIQIIFKNPDGTTVNYVPPGTPPEEVSWARYVNSQDNYAIDYPSNWQKVLTEYNGHEGISVYPPHTDSNSQDTPYVGFGWSPNNLLPISGNLANATATSILVDGMSGTLYTNGPLGSSYIATTFSYTSGYFGLASSASDVNFAYVYYHMIHSLSFSSQ